MSQRQLQVAHQQPVLQYARRDLPVPCHPRLRSTEETGAKSLQSSCGELMAATAFLPRAKTCWSCTEPMTSLLTSIKTQQSNLVLPCAPRLPCDTGLCYPDPNPNPNRYPTHLIVADRTRSYDVGHVHRLHVAFPGRLLHVAAAAPQGRCGASCGSRRGRGRGPPWRVGSRALAPRETCGLCQPRDKRPGAAQNLCSAVLCDRMQILKSGSRHTSQKNLNAQKYQAHLGSTTCRRSAAI